ncbi:hypothetical protein FHETE_5296 [Fusarium heterosporum]|uniref:Uncharacterized protein n=1 Tax=Fusarium heterosporum TaxID=42747 RepID=A0A8H5WRJ1_FUSHE|nr:hypothetical protein FHETE_5296 [Fusarium heterosporum]
MAYETTDAPDVLPTYSSTDYPSSISSFSTIGLGSKAVSASDPNITNTISGSLLPTTIPTPTAIHAVYSSLATDDAYTTTQFAKIATTVTYATINSNSPASLIATCVPITLLYTPCKCESQVYPSVDMTTIVYIQGQTTATLTVPKAAYETGSRSYSQPIVQLPPGWNEEHQTDAGGDIFPVAQPKVGTHHDSQPRHRHGQAGNPNPALDPQRYSRPSHKNHQYAIPTSASGSRGNYRQAQGNRQPSAPAQGDSLSNDGILPRPTQSSVSKSLTTGTAIILTPELNTSRVLPLSSTSHQEHGSFEHKESSPPTPMVVSTGLRNHSTFWIMIVAMMGMLLL